MITIPDANRRNRRDLFQETSSDRLGHFKLRGLIPGEYRIIAIDEAIDEEITDPEFVHTHESMGQTIKIEEGQSKSLMLRLSPSGD